MLKITKQRSPSIRNKVIGFLFTLLLWSPPIVALASELKVRKIIPPNLKAKYLGKTILYHHSVRHGLPKMTIEQKNGKIITYNYGHGDKEWTLGPGSAKYINNLLNSKYKANSKYIFSLTKDTPITIIGAGAIGLFTAYDLHKKGFHNITIITEQFENLVFYNTKEIMAPVSIANNPEDQQIIDQIWFDAYKFYANIIKKLIQILIAVP